MNIDFLANVNKTPETPFAQSNQFGAVRSGFREEIDQAMRDNDRRYESAVEKKHADNKKSAVAEESRNSAKADAPKKNDRPNREAADNKVAATDATGHAEETPEEILAGLALTGEASGFLGELEEADKIIILTPQDNETSETENAYTSTPAIGTPVPGDIAENLISFSTDPALFSSLIMDEDPGSASIINVDVAVAAGNAGSSAGQNVAALVETISNIADGLSSAGAPMPEAADVNIPKDASLSGGDATSGMKELLEVMSGELETANVKIANLKTVQPEAKEILENAILPKEQAATQNSERNSAASLRGDALRNEVKAESKIAVNAEMELSEQSSSRSPSENEAQLMERMSAQITRPRENGNFTNVYESAGKTVQFAEASIQAASGAAKAEAAAPPRSVNVQDQEFIIELAGRIQAQIRGGREMIRIQLHPEELGRLEIRAESGRNGIIARIAAETTDVKKLLENNIQNLQQMLESRGLKIDRLHIVVEENAYAAFADAGRYGHAGTGQRNPDISEFSNSARSGIELLQEEDADDLSTEAEQRGVGFYTVG